MWHGLPARDSPPGWPCCKKYKLTLLRIISKYVFNPNAEGYSDFECQCQRWRIFACLDGQYCLPCNTCPVRQFLLRHLITFEPQPADVILQLVIFHPRPLSRTYPKQPEILQQQNRLMHLYREKILSSWKLNHYNRFAITEINTIRQ